MKNLVIKKWEILVLQSWLGIWGSRREATLLLFVHPSSIPRGGRRNYWTRHTLYIKLHTHEMCVKNINTECVRTNLWNKGLISVDRRTKPTLVLTIPRSVVKSSTKDLSFPIFGIVFQGYAAGHQVVWMAVVCPNLMMLDPKAYSHSLNTGKGEYRRFPAWILT